MYAMIKDEDIQSVLSSAAKKSRVWQVKSEKHKKTYWVLKKGKLYFNTMGSNFYTGVPLSDCSRFHDAYRFPSLERIKEFQQYHKSSNLGKYQIVEVSETVTVLRSFKKV